MKVNGLGSFDLMSNYNRIDVTDRAVNSISPVTPVSQETVAPVTKAAPEEKTSTATQAPDLKVNLNFDGMRRSSSVGLSDITRDFGKREPFTMTRFDDQSMRDDMLKAVSQMEQDSSLMQYQYFVGENNVILNDEDGIVIMK